MVDIQKYSLLFKDFLSSNQMKKEPYSLYEPADYILALGGKRLRPIFALIGCGLYNNDVEMALKAAMAVEIFHNFTLLHDDIMDASDLRRGMPTVHKKYDVNTAILSGDVMMIKAYQFILDYDDPVLVKKLMVVFNKMAIDVCEGQQLDVDFESRQDVAISDYIHMITLKTSVLISAAIQMGAIIGGTSPSDQHHLHKFAINFGVAFQLQDDFLDTFGDSAEIGKIIGGDIIRNKKTYLYIKSLELASESQKERLSELYSSKSHPDNESKINEVKSIFREVNVPEYSRQVIEAYRDLSISHLHACQISDMNKKELSDFIDSLIIRKS
jgi:geranylgeranyl diphosphate synthase type II